MALLRKNGELGFFKGHLVLKKVKSAVVKACIIYPTPTPTPPAPPTPSQTITPTLCSAESIFVCNVNPSDSSFSTMFYKMSSYGLHNNRDYYYNGNWYLFYGDDSYPNNWGFGNSLGSITHVSDSTGGSCPSEVYWLNGSSTFEVYASEAACHTPTSTVTPI